MGKKHREKFASIITVRLSKNEKRELDKLMLESQTTKSAFIRSQVKNILKSVSVKD